jgi:hypothetical protein
MADDKSVIAVPTASRVASAVADIKETTSAIGAVTGTVRDVASLFKTEHKNESSLSNFTKGEGYKSLELVKTALCFEGNYTMGRQMVLAEIARIGGRVNPDIITALESAIPDIDALTATYTNCTVRTPSGKMAFAAAINPQFAIFNLGKGGTHFYAMMAVDFLKGEGPVRILLNVSELKFSLADNWHIETTTSSSSNLFGSKSSSHQNIVYTQAKLTVEQVRAHEELLASSSASVMNIANQLRLSSGCLEGSAPRATIEAAESTIFRNAVRDERKVNAAGDMDENYPEGYNKYEEGSIRCAYSVAGPPEQQGSIRTVRVPLTTLSSRQVGNLLTSILSADCRDLCERKNITGELLVFIESVEDLTREGFEIMSPARGRLVMAKLEEFKSSGAPANLM